MEHPVISAAKILAVLCIAGASAASEAKAPGGDQAKIVKAHQRYVSSVVANNLPGLRESISTLDFSPPVAQEFKAEFERYFVSSRKSGVRLVEEKVRHIDVYSEGSNKVAFIQVEGVFEHPIPPTTRRETYTTYAISTDAGATWKVNALSCFEAVHLSRMFPHYPGRPG